METTLKKCSVSFDYGMNAAATAFDGINKYIRITDIDEHSSKYISENPVSPLGIAEDKYLVNENDILFARTGASTGKTYYYDINDGRLYFAGFLIRVRINKNLNSKFIFFQTQCMKYNKWVKLMSARSGQPGINANEYSTYNFFLPKIVDEQNKIAALLSLIDQRIETQNKIIEKYKSLIKGITDTFTDENTASVLFSKLYSKAGEGGTPSTTAPQYYENGTIPFIKIDDLSEKYITHNFDYITKAGLANSSAWMIPSNCVIYSNGATIGRVSINTYSVATKQGVLGIIPSVLITSEYLYYFLSSKYFRKQVCRITVKGTMECAYLKDLNTIKCYIPSKEKQDAITMLLSAIDTKIRNETAILTKFVACKKHILYTIFI